MDLSEIVGKIKPSLPVILVADSCNNIIEKGSGFVYRQKDLVVTCAHVVSNVKDGSINLQFSDNKDSFISAKVVITDHEHDIALLKFESDTERAPLEPNLDIAKEGMPVFFSGYPFELMDLTTYQGIISSVSTDPTGMTSYLIDGTINPGNSGGPLMSIDGKVIGVINATRRNSNDTLSKLNTMPIGALSLHGLDIVELYRALTGNLQLGLGYAVPSAYIPKYSGKISDKGKTTDKKAGKL